MGPVTQLSGLLSRPVSPPSHPDPLDIRDIDEIKDKILTLDETNSLLDL